MAIVPNAKTFFIDCPRCKAKVAANEKGRAKEEGGAPEHGEIWGYQVLLGTCPHCHMVLVGEAVQIEFASLGLGDDQWSDVVRIYPDPPKTFSPDRIPPVVTKPLIEAARCMQAGANDAACVMFGRALEGLCQDVLKSKHGITSRKTLAKGIEKLKEKKEIDDRLYKWSGQLRAFRNLAAHASDQSVSSQDAKDLQSFVHAIIEYVYDLTARYEEFVSRVDAREKLKNP